MVSQRLKDYELVAVLSPESTDEEAEATMERIAAFISERGGAVSERESWGVRRLAYPIQRFQEGNYVLTRFSLNGQDVVELDRNLNASQDVLTHLVTKPSKPVKPARAIEDK